MRYRTQFVSERVYDNARVETYPTAAYLTLPSRSPVHRIEKDLPCEYIVVDAIENIGHEKWFVNANTDWSMLKFCSGFMAFG